MPLAIPLSNGAISEIGGNCLGDLPSRPSWSECEGRSDDDDAELDASKMVGSKDKANGEAIMSDCVG